MVEARKMMIEPEAWGLVDVEWHVACPQPAFHLILSILLLGQSTFLFSSAPPMLARSSSSTAVGPASESATYY